MNNMVAMKYNIIWIVFTFIIFPIILIASIINTLLFNDYFYLTETWSFPIVNDIPYQDYFAFMGIWIFPINIVVGLTLIVLILSWIPNLIFQSATLVLRVKHYVDKYNVKYMYETHPFMSRLKGTLLVCFSSFPIILLSIFISAILHKKLPDWMPFIIIVLFLVLINLMLNWALNFRVVLNDDGITKENKINFLFFTIYKRTNTLLWDEICEIDSTSIWAGITIFMYTKKWQRIFQHINFMFTNRNEGLEYIIRKLTICKFAIEAQEKFKKMNISISYKPNLYDKIDSYAKENLENKEKCKLFLKDITDFEWDKFHIIARGEDVNKILGFKYPYSSFGQSFSIIIIFLKDGKIVYHENYSDIYDSKVIFSIRGDTLYVNDCIKYLSLSPKDAVFHIKKCGIKEHYAVYPVENEDYKYYENQ
jgi:hypothetical protein